MKKWLHAGVICITCSTLGIVILLSAFGIPIGYGIDFRIGIGLAALIMAFFAFLGWIEIIRNKNKAYAIAQMDSGAAPICDLKMKLVSGLPSAAGADCRLVAGKDTITLVCGGRTYNIAMKQMRGVETFMEKEAMKEFRLRPGRAVAGGILFGSVGAIIGGMPKSSDMEAKDRMFFILNYVNAAGEGTFILLESPDFKIKKCVEDFLRYIPSEELETINL